jgi:hypothetical protein
MVALPWWVAVTGNIFNVEIQAIFWASLIFIGVYSYLAPWWKTSMGRSLVIMDGALTVGILPSLLGRYFGLHLIETEWVAWLDVACFLVIPAVVISRIWLVGKVNWNNVKMLKVRDLSRKLRTWLRSHK